ncbi:hypothetical protein C8Q76DRAFT_801053 [Earliella scabrosa]|nr:hypothetical protein C8Q76DRAFT_801053 [Earliella scabrosa]
MASDPVANVSIGFSNNTFQILQWSVEMATSTTSRASSNRLDYGKKSLKPCSVRHYLVSRILARNILVPGGIAQWREYGAELFTVITATLGRMLVLKRQTQTSTIVLLAAIVAIYTSTATYWAILLSQTSELYQDCTGTAALDINVVIGDAIVWWRAWVVWRQKRLASTLAAASILLMFVTGTVDAVDTCRAGGSLITGLYPALIILVCALSKSDVPSDTPF